MKPFIYKLVDPREPEQVRYIGAAFSDPYRPANHAQAARRGNTDSPRLMNWIRSLDEEGQDYDWTILEEFEAGTSREVVGASEQTWIERFRTEGHRLTNIAEGGQGRTGPHSFETRAKIRRAWTAEKRAAHSIALTGRERSEEHKRNLAASYATRASQWTPERQKAHSAKMIAVHAAKRLPA